MKWRKEERRALIEQKDRKGYEWYYSSVSFTVRRKDDKVNAGMLASFMQGVMEGTWEDEEV